jgi:hypothetical protein
MELRSLLQEIEGTLLAVMVETAIRDAPARTLWIKHFQTRLSVRNREEREQEKDTRPKRK